MEAQEGRELLGHHYCLGSTPCSTASALAPHEGNICLAGTLGFHWLPMAKAKRKEEAVTGVLVYGAGGINGSRGWEATLDLEPWAREDGTLQDGSLTVYIPVAYSRLDALRERLSEGTVVRVRIWAKRTINGYVRARGRFPVRKVRPSPQLLARRAELDKPVVLEHPLFGKLTLDRGLGAYKGKARVGGGRLEVLISVPDGAMPSAHPRYVEKAAASLTRALSKTRERERALVDYLLDLYNDTWREKGPELKARAFLSRITLDGATVHEDGSLTLYHRDGGLFRRHTIEVRVGKDGRMREATLAG